MFKYWPVYLSALQLLFNYRFANCSQPSIRKLNPYENIFKNLLKEPPVSDNNTRQTYDNNKELWLEQLVDHFDKANTDKWLMRYFVNDKFYQPGSPIFIFVGGEWEIQPHILQSGHFYDMAKQHEAIMFYTEHRYYGQSWPKGNLSLNNLEYLSVLQSLADLKYFIGFQKSSHKALLESKVVLVGGSYSGSMVTWFMNIYPGIANAAWASSAPLIAKMDFPEYMSLTMNSIQEKGGSECAKKLHEAFESLVKIMKTSQFNRVIKRLNMCETFNNSETLDRQAFFNGLGNYFGSLVQSYSAFIPQFCLSFTASDMQPLEALIKYLAELFKPSLSAKLVEQEENAEVWCLDFSYQGLKSVFTNENVKTGTRPWFYQTCYEFGWFSTTSTSTYMLSFLRKTSSSPIFGGQVPLTYFQQLCQDVFENVGHGNVKHHDNYYQHQKHYHRLALEQMHNRAEIINKIFGGLSNVSQRVIFTHGLLDPWRAAGLLTGTNVLLLNDYSHVDDMGSIKLSDTVEMNVAKLKVASFINRLIRNH